MSNIQDINGLLAKMWQDYVALNPQAGKIYDLLTQEGNEVLNDHIALRTFNDPRVNVDVVAGPFIQSGYEERGQYQFVEKKLFAKHYEHKDNPLMPKIFISELKLEEFSEAFQKQVQSLIDQLRTEDIERFDFSSLGRPWKLSYQDYQELQKESDYGAWLAAIGYRPNHFTVNVNHLKKFESLKDLNDFIKKSGFKLNESGGEIKGSSDVFLEQSSTLADQVEVSFSDGPHTVTSCYYEFAKRYPKENGEFYQGFVAQSADKIFESTDRGQD